MVERLLWQVRVVQPHVSVQGLTQVLGAVEAVGLQHLLKPAVEPLDHAVGLWRARPGESVLNAQAVTQEVEFVIARGVLGAAAEQPVGELLAVVGQDGADHKRRCLGQLLEEAASGCGRLAPLDRDEHPAGGTVNGHEHVAARGFVGHLGQVLHVDVDVSRLIGLEGLGRRSLGRRLGPLVNASAHQHPVQGRPTHHRVDEFAHHGKQVVQRQAQLLAQVDNPFLLPSVQRGLQPMRRVAAVFHRVAMFPALNGGAADAVLRSQFVLGGRRLLDLRPHRRGGCGVLVQRDHHAVWLPEANAAMTAFSTSRPKSRDRLLCRSQSSGTRQLAHHRTLPSNGELGRLPAILQRMHAKSTSSAAFPQLSHRNEEGTMQAPCLRFSDLGKRHEATPLGALPYLLEKHKMTNKPLHATNQNLFAEYLAMRERTVADATILISLLIGGGQSALSRLLPS